MRTTWLARLVAVVILAGCGGTEPPVRTELTPGEVDALRARLARVHPGMMRPEVFAALDLPLERLAQIGTGPTTAVTTIYILDAQHSLYLTWNATRPDATGLLCAQLLERGDVPIECPPLP